jgi:hypothetical protein
MLAWEQVVEAKALRSQRWSISAIGPADPDTVPGLSHLPPRPSRGSDDPDY